MKFNLSLLRSFLILENAETTADMQAIFKKKFDKFADDVTETAVKNNESLIKKIIENAGDYKKLENNIKAYIIKCEKALLKEQPAKVSAGSGLSFTSSVHYLRLYGEVYLITQDARDLDPDVYGKAGPADPTFRAAIVQLTSPFKNQDESKKQAIYKKFYELAKTYKDFDSNLRSADFDAHTASAVSAAKEKGNLFSTGDKPKGSGGGSGAPAARSDKAAVDQVSPYADTAEQRPFKRNMRNESRTHSLQRNSDIRRLRRIIREVLETI